MSDQEFDLLDEVYFVTSYQDIQAELGWEDAEMKKTLLELYEKGWIKCFADASTELVDSEVDLEKQYQQYHYLASKKGLLAHNGR
jgi:hypothetical protein